MSARKLPDIDTLLLLRQAYTLKEIGAMYGASAVAVHLLLREAKDDAILKIAQLSEKLELLDELELLKKANAQLVQELLMHESKRRAWAAWDEKRRR